MDFARVERVNKLMRSVAVLEAKGSSASCDDVANVCMVRAWAVGMDPILTHSESMMLPGVFRKLDRAVADAEGSLERELATTAKLPKELSEIVMRYAMPKILR